MYRFRQFFGALTAHIGADDEQVLAHLLTSPQRDLFRRMALNDQRHGLNVCATLRQAGYDDPALLAAALLHDVGKAAGRIWLWQRTLIVLLRRWAPDLLCRLERGGDATAAPWWRRGFVINRLHAELGADWAAQAGCSPLTTELIRRHQQKDIANEKTTVPPGEDTWRHISKINRLLAALQWADGVN